ncbi:MAG: hypothetical protein RLP14_09935 [Owenweeksia sp.]
MKKLILFLPAVWLTLACSKNEAGSAGQVGQKPSVTIVSPLVQVDLTDSVDVLVRFSDDSGLQSAAIALTKIEGDITYHSALAQLNGNTADTLHYKAGITGGFDISGSNVIQVQCIDTDGNITIEEELFTLREKVDPLVSFNSFTSTVTSAPNQVISVDFTLSDNLGLDNYKAELWGLNSLDQAETLWKKFDKAGLNGQTSYTASHNYLSTSNGYPSGSRYRVIVTVSDISGNTASYNSETGTVN